MLFEDLHWIDPSSRELLDRMIERAVRLPLLLVLTFRPEFQAPWTGLSHVTSLTLSRLDSQNGAAMVSFIAGERALPEALAQVRDGGLAATIEQFPAKQCSMSVQILADFLKNGKKPEQQITLLTPIAITKANLSEAERLGEVK